jgi:hypothetical protein
LKVNDTPALWCFANKILALPPETAGFHRRLQASQKALEQELCCRGHCDFSVQLLKNHAITKFNHSKAKPRRHKKALDSPVKMDS